MALRAQMKGKLEGKSSRVLELATRLSYLTPSVFKVVLRTSTPHQTRQIILNYFKYEREVDGSVKS